METVAMTIDEYAAECCRQLLEELKGKDWSFHTEVEREEIEPDGPWRRFCPGDTLYVFRVKRESE